MSDSMSEPEKQPEEGGLETETENVGASAEPWTEILRVGPLSLCGRHRTEPPEELRKFRESVDDLRVELERLLRLEQIVVWLSRRLKRRGKR